jgi:hypothetical protein
MRSSGHPVVVATCRGRRDGEDGKGGMMGEPVRWSDDLDDVIRGDITAAAAYITPAKGAAVTAVAPCGIGQRDLGLLGFTTSLGFGKKLERIIADPHVALAFHAREHGFRQARCSCWSRARRRWTSGPRVPGWRR